MTKRAQIPGPRERLLPRVIRSFGARLVILLACSALLVVGGGGYLISRIEPNNTSPTSVEAKKLDTTSPTSSAQNAQVLGDSTDTPTGSSPGAAQQNQSVIAAGSSSTTTSTNTAATVETPSFDIVIDTNGIKNQGLGAVYVPFTVIRHGGFGGSIVPSEITVTSGGSLTNLITIGSKRMIDADHGSFTLLPVGLFPKDITIKLQAISGKTIAATSLNYRISL
jgi:hypothetical protein